MSIAAKQDCRIAFFAAATTALTLAGTTHATGLPDMLWEVQGHSHTVNAVAFSPDGTRIASGADYTDSTAKIWDAATGALLQEFPAHSWGVLSVDFAPPHGRYLAVGFIQSGYAPGGLVHVWDTDDGTLVHEFGGALVDFSADGERLASGGGGVNRYAYIHELASGQRLARVYNGSYLTSLALTPDGQLLATGGSDNTIKLWDAHSGDLLNTLNAHQDDVSALAISPDGSLLASGAGGFDDPSDSTIKIWSLPEGSLLQTLSGHDQWVNSLDFTPSGDHLISSGRDGANPPTYSRIRLWNVADGALIQTYDQGLDYGVPAIQFSPDGATFAYGRGQGQIALAQSPFTTCPADLDGDGDTDQADLGILLAAYNQSADGDLDGDSDTDQADLGILLANYNCTP
jgi:WD40 repeat protein